MLNISSIYEGAYTLFVLSTMYTACMHMDLYKKDMARLGQKARGLPKTLLYIITHMYVSFSLLKDYVKTSFNSAKNANVYMKEYPDKHYIEIGYMFRDELYKIRIQTKKGPKKMMMADADGNPVSEELCSYLGPMEDGHSISIKPSDFGWKQVVVYLTDGSEKTFEENDPIKF
jgi:hypothetical protein